MPEKALPSTKLLLLIENTFENGILDYLGAGKCDSQVSKGRSLASRLGATGVPFLILENGRSGAGYFDPDLIIKEMEK